MTEPPYKPAGATHLADDRADDAAGGVFVRRNYLLGIANGALGRVGMTFTDPNLILAAFVYKQTSSNTLVGLLGTLGTLGMFFPQLYISRLIEHRPRKKPFYVGAMVLRITSMAFMAATMLLTGTTGSCSLAAGPGGAVLAQAPYGIDAECVMPVEVRCVARPAAGTDWPRALRSRGYDGI